LGKEVLHEFKQKGKLKATQGNLMNPLDLANRMAHDLTRNPL
jgi:hypothetical protein